MNTNKYAVAGWLAIVQAILFPLTFVFAFIEEGIAQGLLHTNRPFFGPSDLITLICTVISVYVLWMFRKLLNEQFESHDLDLLILISIWWSIMFEIVGVGLGILVIMFWPVDKILLGVVYLVFLTASLVTIGIVDILIAVKLLKIKEVFSEYIRLFAYLTLVTGISEVTVLLFPVALLLVPVVCIVLALIFFRGSQDVQYV